MSNDDASDANWLFERCRMHELAVCVAWRACSYMRKTRKHSDAVTRFNALFSDSLYPFPVDPFVTQCLWTATQVETQLYTESSFVSVAIDHKKSLARGCADADLELRNIAFAIAHATEWRLMPISPFVHLAEWQLPPTLELLASNIIEEATIGEIIGSLEPSDRVAAAAVVAVDCLNVAGGANDAFRCVRAIVACSVAKSVNIWDIVTIAIAFETHFARASYSQTPRQEKKRKHSAQQTASPTSVVPEKSVKTCNHTHSETAHCSSAVLSPTVTPSSSSAPPRCP